MRGDPIPAAEVDVQFVPSDFKIFPEVPGTAHVSVDAVQLVPSDTIIFRVVALAFGKVGVDKT